MACQAKRSFWFSIATEACRGYRSLLADRGPGSPEFPWALAYSAIPAARLSVQNAVYLAEPWNRSWHPMPLAQQPCCAADWTETASKLLNRAHIAGQHFRTATIADRFRTLPTKD